MTHSVMGDRQMGWTYGPESGISTRSLAWIAGFLEGEGSFGAYKAAVVVSAVQRQKEPLERLHLALGGTLRCYVNKRGALVWYWRLYGAHAIGVAFTLYTFMSPRRRDQIRKMVAAWKLRPGKNNALTTVCPRGHDLTPENIYLMNGRHRGCRECYRTFYPTSRLEREA